MVTGLFKLFICLQHNFEAEKNAKKANGKKFLITFVCIFLSIVILTAIIVGVVGIVNDRNAVVKYDGVSLTEAELNYFVSYCKYDILKKQAFGMWQVQVS